LEVEKKIRNSLYDIKNQNRVKNKVLIYTGILFHLLLFVKPLQADELVLILETSAGETRFCQGSSFSLIARGLHGDEILTEYLWEADDPGLFSQSEGPFAVLQGTTPGNHLVTFTGTDDQGNKASVSITITVLQAPNPEVSVSHGFLTRLFGKELPLKLEATNPSSGSTYQWFRNNEIIEGAVSRSFKARQTGRYRLVVTSAEGCKAYSRPIEIPMQTKN
jgi:hypothetical protein